MSDDKANPGRTDRDRINLAQDSDVRSARKSLGTSEEAPVRMTGNQAPKGQALAAHSAPGYQAGRLGRIASVLRFA
jgi:hypothetical protein